MASVGPTTNTTATTTTTTSIKNFDKNIFKAPRILQLFPVRFLFALLLCFFLSFISRISYSTCVRVPVVCDKTLKKNKSTKSKLKQQKRKRKKKQEKYTHRPRRVASLYQKFSNPNATFENQNKTREPKIKRQSEEAREEVEKKQPQNSAINIPTHSRTHTGMIYLCNI